MAQRQPYTAGGCGFNSHRPAPAGSAPRMLITGGDAYDEQDRLIVAWQRCVGRADSKPSFYFAYGLSLAVNPSSAPTIAPVSLQSRRTAP